MEVYTFVALGVFQREQKVVPHHNETAKCPVILRSSLKYISSAMAGRALLRPHASRTRTGPVSRGSVVSLGGLNKMDQTFLFFNFPPNLGYSSLPLVAISLQKAIHQTEAHLFPLVCPG